jgi:hypothetical protein
MPVVAECIRGIAALLFKVNEKRLKPVVSDRLRQGEIR